MSFYFTRIASALRRSKNNLLRMKDDFDKYKELLENKNPEIYKRDKGEKIFGMKKEEINKSPQEKMKRNPFYWYHQLKQKALDTFTTKDKYKLLDKANTDIEMTSPSTSKVMQFTKVDSFYYKKAVPHCTRHI
jgi:hypothetical protein